MSEYAVVLLGENSREIVSDTVSGMVNAKKRARYLLSDDFIREVEGSPGEGIGSEKVEVRDLNGECLWDAFRKGRPRPLSVNGDDDDDELDGPAPSARF